MGLDETDFSDEEKFCYVWPDNWQTVSVFCAMRKQWRVGPGGPYGLDLGVLPEIWTRLKVPEEERDDIFESLVLMEDVALGVMQQQARSRDN